MVHFLLNPIGTAGDVHPHVAIGIELLKMGHAATMIATPNFQELAESNGISFQPIGSHITPEMLSEDKRLRKPMSAWKAAMEWAAVGMLEEIYNQIVRLHVPGDTMVVAPVWSLGARVAREKLPIALANVILNPCLLRSCKLHPVLPNMPMYDWTPEFFKSIQYWFADVFVLDPIMRPQLNSFRKRLGLKSVSRIMHRWWFSPDVSLGMFTEMLVPRMSDWPVDIELVGPTLWDPPVSLDVSEQVHQFLGDDKQTVVIVPGSAGPSSNQFVNKVVHASHELNRRVLLLSPIDIQNLPSISDTFLQCAYAPLKEVLPRCGLIVHSGCIGTSSQALASATPQLVYPQVNDQLDNAARLNRIGVSLSISSRQMSPSSIINKIQSLLDGSQFKAACIAAQSNHLAGSARQAAVILERTASRLQVGHACRA